MPPNYLQFTLIITYRVSLNIKNLILLSKKVLQHSYDHKHPICLCSSHKKEIDRSLRSCNKQCCTTAVNNIGKESRSCMKRHIEQKLNTYIEKLLKWKLSQNLIWKSENVQCLNSHQISHSHCQSGFYSINCCTHNLYLLLLALWQ